MFFGAVSTVWTMLMLTMRGRMIFSGGQLSTMLAVVVTAMWSWQCLVAGGDGYRWWPSPRGNLGSRRAPSR